MATTRQAVEAIDTHLRLNPSTARWHAERLRAVHLIPNSQGKPSQISSGEIALILISILSASAGDPEVVQQYAELRAAGRRLRLVEIVARFIDDPSNLFEICVDQFAPSASVTFRGEDGGIVSLSFDADEPQSRPAYERQAKIGPAPMIHLAAALKAAPEAKTGRKRRRNRHN